MDLDPIGRHCALQSCNVLDFLPIQCSCLRWFCKLHISPDLHDCASLQQRPSESPSTWVRSKCALLGCDKLPLSTGVDAADHSRDGEPSHSIRWACPGCQLSFCIGHRHMQSHSCTSLAIKEDVVKHRNNRADLAQKLFAASSSTRASHTPLVPARRPANLPSDPKKLAQLQKINLMKLRHKAIPADPKDRRSTPTVPIEQRIHVAVRLEILDQSIKEVTLWFRKTTITGKALDLVVQYLGLSHTDSTLHLKKPSTEFGSLILQNHLELSEQLEDGSTVVLSDSRSNS